MKVKSEIRNSKSGRNPKSDGRIWTSVFGFLSDFGLRISDLRLRTTSRERGSTLIIVMWIAFGLVSLTLYFASSMSFELHASDNRVCGLASDQAIDGAMRYVNYVLASQLTNGTVPNPSSYLCQAVPVGDSHFWLIGRGDGQTYQDQMTFQLVDEGSKLNLNYATSNMMAGLPTPPMTQDLLMGILDWRGTNGGAYTSYYSTQRPPYQQKGGPFETTDELRMVYGATMDALVGDDLNRNGIVDPNETDSHQASVTSGLLDYLTVYTREPMTNSDGSVRVNVANLSAATIQPLVGLLSTNVSATVARAVLARFTPTPAPGGGGGGGGGRGPGGPPVPAAVPPVVCRSPLDFYVQFHAAPSNLSADDFALIANKITVTTGTYIYGRVNINTASATVLACLPGIKDNPSLAQTLISYREANPDKLGSVAWVVDALGTGNNSALNALRAADYLTTQSFQFTADIAAIGPHGRGYRRVRFVFDTVDGAPKIVYRQDMSHLGWALGKDARQTWLTDNGVAAQ
jgi:DNA uptake protein ComE-like DNA-binding protein